MKVCILSMQRVNNFGSVLQAYSLKKMIEGFGHTVVFIDIERRDADSALIGPEDRILFEEEREKSGFWAKIDRYFFNRLLIKVKNRRQNKKLESFRRDVLGCTPNKNEEEYDVCVIGSDEVFNALNPAERGGGGASPVNYSAT